MSAIGLGTWLTFGTRLHDRVATAVVREALDKGINFIDTVDVYDRGKAEEQLGRALEGVPRRDYILASKVFFPIGDGPNDRGLSRKHVFETVHASLRRLKTDYLDLFQCHRFDPDTPLDETVRAFADLIAQGKVHYWGVSVWTAEQIERAVGLAAELNAPAPVTNQPAYSLLKREIEADVLPTCNRLGVGTLCFSPLAQGVLTGKYLDGQMPRDSRAADDGRNRFMGPYLGERQHEQVRRLKTLADAHGLTPAQLALAWLIHRPGVSSVIVGATKTTQVEENAAAGDVELSDDVLTELDGLFPG